MLRYILTRVLLAIPTLAGVAILTFLALRVMPGDIVEAKLRGESGNVSQETIDRERHRLGLDRSLIVQFGDWMGGVATGDFGLSMWTGQPVTKEIGIRLPLTVEVALLATIIGVLIALPLGTLSALYRGTWFDYGVRIITVGGLAMPNFWLGMLMILALLTFFNWLPPLTYTSIWQDPVANLAQLIWPALAVGYRYAAVLARVLRSSVLEILQEDYIRTARAKGLWERLVIWRHAMRNALLPSITVIALEFAFLIGGLVVTEQVFNLNGVGRLFADAVSHLDYVLVQAIVMMIATVYVLVNLLVDVLYAVIDPRIRFR